MSEQPRPRDGSEPWSQLSVLLPTSLKAELAERARREHRTMSRQVTLYLAKALAREETARRVGRG